MPPYSREMPAWSAAAVKDFHERVTGLAGTAPGSTRELPAGMVTASPKVSLPVAALRRMAAAALKVEWPEMYSGNGGVGKVVGWYGSQSSPRKVLVPW
jgi:hypothetical protein